MWRCGAAKEITFSWAQQDTEDEGAAEPLCVTPGTSHTTGRMETGQPHALPMDTAPLPHGAEQVPDLVLCFTSSIVTAQLCYLVGAD